jgi:signal transduction histidine kinase
LRSVKFDPTGELATAIAISALAIAGPTAGLLWFMQRSLQGERQTLVVERATVRKTELQAAKEAVTSQLARLSQSPVSAAEVELPPGQLFLRVVRSHRADSCLILNDRGQPVFPMVTAALGTTEGPTETEDARDLIREFHQPVKPFSDGWQQLMDRLRGRKLFSAASPSGRLYAPMLQVAALQEMRPGELRTVPLLESLKAQVLNYDDLRLPSSQRLYLAARIREHDPAFDHEALAAERLAVLAADRFAMSAPGVFESTRADPNLVQVRTTSPKVVLLYSAASLKRTLENTASAVLEPRKMRAEVVQGPVATSEDPDAIATSARTPLGKTLRAWHLVAHDDMGVALIDAMVKRRKWQYGTIAIVGSLFLNVLAALAVRRFTRTANLTQARQDFLSTLSHELRTPLTSIRMFVDTLSHGGLEDPVRARTYLDFIRRENERLSRLAENFLTFTRLESGRMNFDFEEISPEEVAESARVAVETRFAVEGTDFQVSVERKLPMIHADHTLLTTAVVNLLENAFKYTPENKKILLSVARGHNTVRFTVADNGHGLTPEQMKRIGEKFYRPDAAARSGQPGFGLGLNIVSHIMQAHEGRLEVHTEPNVGSRFTLILNALKTEPNQD